MNEGSQDRQGRGVEAADTVIREPLDTAGTVVRTGPGMYLVRSEGLVWECRLRGRLRARRKRLSDMSICIGDHVTLVKMQRTQEDPSAEVVGTAQISEILPRRTQISRLAPPPWPGATRLEQVLAVNVDLVVVVVAAAAPPLKMTTIDRFLLLARQAGLESVVCINKIDLVGINLNRLPATAPAFGHTARDTVLDARSRLEARGVTTVLASAEAGQGLEELKTLLRGKTSVFVGHSGVGKTSLLKWICPGLDAKTLSVNVFTGKGRHSTTFSSLIDIGGGYVADLPGLRSIGFWDLDEDTVKSEFTDIEEISAQCKFRDCTHSHEPGCAVKEAVLAGHLEEARYLEYLKVMKETTARGRRRGPG